MLTIKISQQDILFLFLSMSTLTIYKRAPTEPTYLLIFILILFIILFNFSKSNKIMKIPCQRSRNRSCVINSIIYYSWIGILFSWLYGALLALINGVPPEDAFRNFFGLTLYILLPILFFVKPTVGFLVKLLIVFGIIQSGYALMYVYTKFFITISLIDSIATARSAYSTGFIVFYPLLALSLSRYIFGLKIYRENIAKNNIIRSIFLGKYYILIYICLLVLVPMSKGFTMGVVVLLLIGILFSVYVQGSRPSKRLLWVVMLISLFSLYLTYEYFDLIQHMYSSKETSNAKRSEQFLFLVREITFFGSGLGSSLQSGYTRSVAGYGFELTYINLIHKLGVFSIFLFISYILTILVAINNILHRRVVYESMLSLGLMSYLIPGIGNPILLSPISVVLHVIAMYILLKIQLNYHEGKYV